MSQLKSTAALLSVALCWGLQYIFLKRLGSLSPFAVMSITMGLSATILALISLRQLRDMDKSTLKKGFKLAIMASVYGVFIFLSARMLPASITGFSGALSLTCIPIIMMFKGHRFQANDFLSLVVELFGLFLATGFSLEGLTVGILFMLVADISIAMYDVTVAEVASTTSPRLLAMTVQAFCCVIGTVGWALDSPGTFFRFEFSGEIWLSLMVITLFVRVYSAQMQMYALRFMTALKAGMVLSLEVVFALVASILISPLIGMESEVLTAGKALGCVLIMCGIYLSSFNALGRVKKWWADRKAQ